MEGSSCSQVTNSTTLAAALIDSHTTTSTHNMRGRLATDASRLRGVHFYFIAVYLT